MLSAGWIGWWEHRIAYDDAVRVATAGTVGVCMACGAAVDPDAIDDYGRHAVLTPAAGGGWTFGYCGPVLRLADKEAGR